MATFRWNRIRDGHTEDEAKAATTVAELEAVVAGLGFYCPKCHHLMMDNMSPEKKAEMTIEEMKAIDLCGRCISGETDEAADPARA